MTPKPRRALLYAGVGTTALGLAALGAGLGLGLAANAASDRISDAARAGQPWTSSLQDEYDAGQAKAHAATAMYVVGGVITATGAVLIGIGAWRARASAPHAATQGGASWAHASAR